MKLKFAIFYIINGKREFTVGFHKDAVSVYELSEPDNLLLDIENAKGNYKPCVTHAVELVDQATKKRTKTEFAKQRQKAQRPNLKVHNTNQ